MSFVWKLQFHNSIVQFFQIEQLALSRTLTQVAVRVCGIFNIDLRFLFEIIANTIIYIMLLMQQQ